MVTVELFGACREAGRCLPGCGLCHEIVYGANRATRTTRTDTFPLEPVEKEYVSLCAHNTSRISSWGAKICSACGQVLV